MSCGAHVITHDGAFPTAFGGTCGGEKATNTAAPRLIGGRVRVVKRGAQ
jgi:hypothetical protein